MLTIFPSGALPFPPVHPASLPTSPPNKKLYETLIRRHTQLPQQVFLKGTKGFSYVLPVYSVESLLNCHKVHLTTQVITKTPAEKE